jgi:hypothetical protein
MTKALLLPNWFGNSFTLPLNHERSSSLLETTHNSLEVTIYYDYDSPLT